MVMIVGISAAVAAITLVVLALVMIPAITEVKKTATALREFIDQTETELKPVLRDLHETLTDLKVLAGGAADKVEEVHSFMEALGDTGRNLRTINNIVGAVAGVLAQSSIWMTGAKVAGKFVLERLSKKRG
ncbi:MAG: hypothetical protein FD174_1940 [Geobacteraceae bacterium]|nr:MAG: hypothetical protein FD174_1940 [Geobacteraceae bacterium]